MNAPHKIDATKGARVGTVSSQWFGRPDDQRFTSLDDLGAQVALWAASSREFDVAPDKFVAEGYSKDGENTLLIRHPDIDGERIAPAPTNYGFADIARLAGAPSRYLSKLPAALAADCLNEGFSKAGDKLVQAYVGGIGDDGEALGSDGFRLRGLTSPSYGRILDKDVVAEVQKIAGSGTGDTRWKVPGMIDWSNMTYNSNVDITKDNTTLYASDRDLFLFLVDDKNPVEVGKLAGGEPDLMFRGFYAWNSEVGDRTFGIATMYLRGVCMNRNLWGVEGFTEATFRHTSGAPERFMTEVAPALESYANTSASKLVAGVAAAKAEVVTPGDSDEAAEARIAFFRKLGFSAAQAQDLVLTSIVEEGRPPESIWDYAQAMTAAARGCAYQDQRVKLEQQAGKLLDKVQVPA